MKYAHVDENGQLLGWYDDTIHSNIPEPNIMVTETQWQSAIQSNHNKVTSEGVTSLYDFRTSDQKIKDENNKKLVEAKKYLNETDFYYIRKLETGEEISPEIVQKRIDYRELIRTLEG